MQKIMLLTSSDDRELADKVFKELKTLDYEVLYPQRKNQQDLEQLAQVDLFVLAGRRTGKLEGLVRTLRQDEVLSEIPRLVITEEPALEDFDYCRNADDILIIPYGRTELAARIKILSWRNQKVDPSNVVHAGSLVINLSTYEVTVGGVLVDLTFKEYELLRYLATHARRVHTRRELLTRVWGEDYYGGARTVDVHIRRIRAKIETGGQVYIQTVRGVGYRFIG
ncbi:MAG TPA: response regulator transcription factor [archaeon]|nr:response regulator transcription factor [archaeon]